MNSYFDSVTLIITEECTLRCTYCYEQKGQYSKINMDEKTAKQSIDFLIDNAKKSNGKSINVTFFGGEPTLSVPLMNFVFDYALEEGKKYDIKPRFKIITNCTVFNDDLYKFIEKWNNKLGNVEIQLSIDGLPEIQDKHRVYANGQGSSKMVEQVVKKYIECFNALNIPIDKLSVHGVMAKEGVNYLYDSYKYLKSLGINIIWFMPLHEDEWDEQSVADFEIQLEKISNEIFEECKVNKDLKSYYGFTSLSNCKDKKPNAPCGAGKFFCAITPNGDIYPCQRFYYYDSETKLGNVFDGVDENKQEIFKEYGMDNMFGDKSCSDCDNLSCRICIAANYEFNDNMFLGFANYCKISRKEDEMRKKLKARLIEEGLMKDNNSKCDSNGCGINTEVNTEELVNVIKALEKYIDNINVNYQNMDNKINALDGKVNALFDVMEELILAIKNGGKK